MADSALFLILTKRPLLAFENDVMEWRVHPWNLLSTIYAKFLKILMSGLLTYKFRIGEVNALKAIKQPQISLFASLNKCC